MVSQWTLLGACPAWREIFLKKGQKSAAVTGKKRRNFRPAPLLVRRTLSSPQGHSRRKTWELYGSVFRGNIQENSEKQFQLSLSTKMIPVHFILIYI
jgi:hypothetical protein